MKKQYCQRVDRLCLNFPMHVTQLFAFLIDMGYQETITLPTIVTYRGGDIEIRIYQGTITPDSNSITGRWAFESGFFKGRSGQWQVYRSGSRAAAENLWPRQ
jgi:hypothetical protein